MKQRFFAIVLILWSIAPSSAAPAQVLKTATAGDRTSVDLTIYNQNLSLIREERTLNLPKGTSRAILPDIPVTIDGTSLHFLSLTEPSAVKVLEQNYQYDLVHPGKLLERYLGKTVEFVRVDSETKKEYTVTGRLLASGYSGYSATGGMIAEVNGKIEVNPSGRLVLPGLPEGLILKPQLEWLVANSREGAHKAEISYLAGGLSWSADYVALLGADESKLDLTGWVTVTNGSGTGFTNAGLKLVAGDVNVVQEAFGGSLRAQKAVMMEADAAAPQFKQTELFEYKMYALQRRTDLRNNETKQIELTSGKNVAAKKVFIYDGLSDQWRMWHNNYSYRSQGSVFVTFKNEEKSGLGIPLPKGRVRVYKRDDDGKEQFVGEDRIDHTPKNEEVRLYLGNAFDIVGERVQKDFKSFAGNRIVEESIELKVRNHKNETVEVMVYEHPWRWSQWEIVNANGEWEKVDQTTIKFPVRLSKDQERIVRYTIRYSW
jgi:hypothetical protein